MNISHALFGQLAGIISFIPVFPYVRSILKGETKPNRASWMIWLVVGVMVFASYFASGARETIWVPLSYVLFPAVVIGFAFKYGEGGFEPFDIACLAAALLGLVLWIVTKDPLKALYINAGVDIVGFLPTIKKTFINSASESRVAWGIAVFSSVLNMLAVEHWNQFHVYFYPVYILTFQSIVLALTLRKKHR